MIFNSFQKQFEENKTKIAEEIKCHFPYYNGAMRYSASIEEHLPIEIAIVADMNWGRLRSATPKLKLTAIRDSRVYYAHTWPYSPKNLEKIIAKAGELKASLLADKERKEKNRLLSLQLAQEQKNELVDIVIPREMNVSRMSDGQYQITIKYAICSLGQVKQIATLLSENC